MRGACSNTTVHDLSQVGVPRAWHRAAHALVALATAAPDRAGGRAPSVRGIANLAAADVCRAGPQLRSRIVARWNSWPHDEDDNVREASIDGLTTVAGHAADGVYIAQLGRQGYQVIRAAASALAETPDPDAAVPALESALQRLTKEGRDNSYDARAQLAATLTSLGRAAKPPLAVRDTPVTSQLNAEDLRRLASARARVTIRDVGVFELALITSEAPATVAAVRTTRRIGLLRRLDVPPRCAQLRHPGRQPRRKRVHRRRVVHARRGRPVAARPRRGRDLHTRSRHRRRSDLHRSRRQPAPRPRVTRSSRSF